MLHTIQNSFLTVIAAEAGGELQSIRGCDGTEYLWQGDPKYWSDRALNLFPYVARLTEGCYELDGQRYQMDIHGIAPYRGFSLKENTGAEMVLELRSDEETRKVYPRDFAFRIRYTLEGSCLKVCYEVENRDEKTMYFGLGGHPGFNVPLAAGKNFEDYRLRFGADCRPQRVGFSEDCFVTGEDIPFPLEAGTIPLRHSLFDDDAIVLRDVAPAVTLECDGDPRAVTVTYPQMPYLGIWHMPRTDAPYVCIEPWVSLPSRKGEIALLEWQRDLISLEAGGTYTNLWTIQIRR